jgi:DNA mismatch repair protein MutL
MAIRVLSASVVQKIAAGEVIERPASVVRELVENSLDAGARHVRVAIVEGGMREIAVADDGAGIARDEVELAFARHATSKLESLDDLDHLRTLGFRGEALFSIASVAEVGLTTCHRGEDLGTTAIYAFGERRELRGDACSEGTTLTVRDLFANLPARRKFVRRAETEAQQVVATVSRYALAHADVSFSLTVDRREVLHTLGGDLLDAIRRVHGPEIGDALLPASSDYEGMSARGYVSPPSLHRSAARHVDIVVNGRAIQDRALNRAVLEAYRGLLPVGRYPVAVILLDVVPDRIDVNVHPAKSEVRFADPDRAFQTVYHAVREAVTQADLVPTMTIGDQPAAAAQWSARQALIEPARHAVGSLPPLDVAIEQGVPVTANSLPPLRPVGQIRQTYIVAEGPDGLYLVDQHAAHERVLFERFMRQRTEGIAAGQPLLTPLPLAIGAQRAAALPRLRDRLLQFGIDLEPFGPETALIRSLPAILAQRGGPIEPALLDIIDSLAGGDEERWLEHSLVRLVCHSAVRAGETLALPQMREILSELEGTRSPRTCPHGRPTMLHLSTNQMEREFRRR